MRRLFPMLLLLLLAACGGPKSDGVQLNVFAAASLQEPLSEIGAAYEQAHPGVALVFHFDSSGTLKTQIQEGAECDLFLSAGQKQMDQLDVTAGPDANPEGLDFVDPETRFDLLENKVVLAVPAGNHLNLQSFENLKDRKSVV